MEFRIHNKKIKLQNSKPVHNNKVKTTAWKSDSTQQVYSTKLLRALSQHRGGTVRHTADRVLAVVARGQTRWSRAIINRVHLKFLHKKGKRSRVATATNQAHWSAKKPRVAEMLKLKAKNIPSVQTKVKILSRLVPGCKKESLPVILEEATDYIPALEMQVRAMRDILSRLSLSGTGNGNISGGSSSLESPVPENGVV